MQIGGDKFRGHRGSLRVRAECRRWWRVAPPLAKDADLERQGLHNRAKVLERVAGVPRGWTVAVMPNSF